MGWERGNGVCLPRIDRLYEYEEESVGECARKCNPCERTPANRVRGGRRCSSSAERKCNSSREGSRPFPEVSSGEGGLFPVHRRMLWRGRVRNRSRRALIPDNFLLICFYLQIRTTSPVSKNLYPCTGGKNRVDRRPISPLNLIAHQSDAGPNARDGVLRNVCVILTMMFFAMCVIFLAVSTGPLARHNPMRPKPILHTPLEVVDS